MTERALRAYPSARLQYHMVRHLIKNEEILVKFYSLNTTQFHGKCHSIISILGKHRKILSAMISLRNVPVYRMHFLATFDFGDLSLVSSMKSIVFTIATSTMETERFR